MAVNLSMLAGAGAQFFDNNGIPLAGGLVYTYAAGTTTPQAAYTTSAGSIAHTNPIVLDSAGRTPSGGEIWLTDAVAYKFVLKTATAVTIGTYDNVTGNASGIYAAFAASSGASLIGYTEGGTGAVATTVQTKLRQYVSFRDFGGDPTGVADSTTAVQNALNSGYPIRDYGTFKITSTINVPAGARIIGVANGGSTGSIGQTLNFTFSGSSVIFSGPETNPGYEAIDWYFEGIQFNGGTNQIQLLNGGVGFTCHNVVFNAPSNCGIYTQGFNQDQYFYSCNFNGGVYGYRLDADGSLGATRFFDKSVFKDCYFSGQTINAARIWCVLSNQITWDTCKLFGQVQDAMWFDGGLRGWTFINLSSESAGGYTGTVPLAPTTGTINAASSSLVVASATGLTIGKSITVEGAGVNGTNLSTTISNVAGTTITLSAAASTSVVSAFVTTYSYSVVKFTNTIATPTGIQFVGGILVQASSVAATKYCVDSSTAYIAFYNLLAEYVYDPNLACQSFGSGITTLKQASALASQNYLLSIIGTPVTNHTVIPSPNGQNSILALIDSAGTSVGTYGNVEVRRYDANRSLIASINGTTGTASFSAVSPGNATGVTSIASQRIFYSSGTPASTAPWNGLAWIVGDRAFNTAPAVGQPKGWLCTAAGTPGTWVSEGNL